ncbi:MAG: ABC transporter permease [Spirochaetes bacterium]|uniref:ABC transporter permease n=1 Tax=Candidatus Ornithospirochaeta stercoripullorum TaxID=2840899 RepID=A0A9D9H4Z5_9SPIO|nr:ABC transporter permease [Candidatus Ornithospirochaeta stercoripullorum]
MNRTKIAKPLEARKASPLVVSLSAVLLGIVAGCIFILCIGKNPFAGFERILFGALSNTRRIGNTLSMSTQLILIGLSVAFAFKTGLFNIGASGQMLMGGITGSILAYYLPLDMPRIIYLPIIIIASMLVGSLWGFISGFLKAKFNVHEVVSTIMLNWIAYWICYDFIPRFIIDPTISVKSKPIETVHTLRADWLTDLTGFSTLNYGFFVAIIMCFVVWFILQKTTLGFNLKAVGSNRFCAEYAGIKVNRSIMISMAIAGALASLAGLTYYCGYSNIMEMGKMPNEGYDGIAVALLGNCSPVGIFFSAIFFGILKMGRGSLAATGIPTEIADTIIATIIYFTATNVILASFWNSIFHRSFTGKEEAVIAYLKAKNDTTPIEKLSKEQFKAYAKEGKALLKNAKKEVE